jgi:hypothetical protein
VLTSVPKIATLIVMAALGCGAIDAKAAAADSTTTTRPGRIEPAAVEALARMSAYLRSIPAFQITLQTQRDDIDVYGQVITLNGSATYKVRRPDGLSIDLRLPNLAGRYVYDGRTMTVYDAKAGAYARFQAPSTIRAALELAEQNYGAMVPLQDLFTWSEGNAQAKALTSAHFVGKTQIAGQAANHYAFRQPGADWQIWIADGDKPAPLRVIIAAIEDPERPQFQADLSWDTAPQFDPGAFDFTPPPDARAIDTNPGR